MSRLACALLAASFAWGQLPPAQAPTPSLSNSRRPNAPLTELEVLATGPNGRLAADLTAADFSFPAAPKLKIASCVYTDTRRERTLVFLVDDLGLSAAAIGQVHDAIQKFVSTSLQPGDRLAILRSGAGDGALQQLTGDKELLARAVERLVYNPRSAYYSSGAARHAAFASGALGALRTAIEGLRRLTGRKSVVLFSLHLNDQPAPDLEYISSAARRAEVSIYGIDPEAAPDAVTPPAPAPSPSATPSGATPVEFTNFALAHLDTAAGMLGLAKQTAGEIIDAAGAVDQALARALDGPDGYYRLGFDADDESYLPALKLTRPGYSLLSTRQVTESAGDLQSLSVPHQRDDELPRAIGDAFHAASLNVSLTPLFYSTKEGPEIDALVHFEVRQLVFRRGLDGTYRGHVDALAAAFGATSQSVSHVSQSFDLVWNEETYRIFLEKGLTVLLRLTGIPAATLQVRALVRDGASDRMGSASQWLEAPNLRNGHLALSGIRLEVDQDPAGKEKTDPPGVRIFHAGQAIHYRCELYNLAADAENVSRVELQVRLFRQGGAVYLEQPMVIQFSPAAEGARRETTGQMKFPSGATPGLYEMQLVITDSLAPSGVPNTAYQFAEFELRP